MIARRYFAYGTALVVGGIEGYRFAEGQTFSPIGDTVALAALPLIGGYAECENGLTDSHVKNIGNAIDVSVRSVGRGIKESTLLALTEATGFALAATAIHTSRMFS